MRASILLQGSRQLLLSIYVSAHLICRPATASGTNWIRSRSVLTSWDGGGSSAILTVSEPNIIRLIDCSHYLILNQHVH